MPGLALGLDSQYQRFSQSGDAQTATSVGPSLSYFFGQPTSTIFPFISASAGFSTLAVEFDGGSGSTNGFRYGFSGGLSYMIARNVALTGAVFYQNQSFSEDDITQTDDAFGFQGGVTAFIF